MNINKCFKPPPRFTLDGKKDFNIFPHPHQPCLTFQKSSRDWNKYFFSRGDFWFMYTVDASWRYNHGRTRRSLRQYLQPSAKVHINTHKSGAFYIDVSGCFSFSKGATNTNFSRGIPGNLWYPPTACRKGWRVALATWSAWTFPVDARHPATPGLCKTLYIDNDKLESRVKLHVRQGLNSLYSGCSSQLLYGILMCI